MGNVRTGLGNVSSHLGEDTLVVVAVEERILVASILGTTAVSRAAASRARRDLVRLETCLLEDNNQTWRVLLLCGSLGDLGHLGDQVRVDSSTLGCARGCCGTGTGHGCDWLGG